MVHDVTSMAVTPRRQPARARCRTARSVPEGDRNPRRFPRASGASRTTLTTPLDSVPTYPLPPAFAPTGWGPRLRPPQSLGEQGGDGPRFLDSVDRSVSPPGPEARGGVSFCAPTALLAVRVPGSAGGEPAGVRGRRGFLVVRSSVTVLSCESAGVRSSFLTVSAHAERRADGEVVGSRAGVPARAGADRWLVPGGWLCP